MVALIVAAALYLHLMYVCGRCTANFAAGTGRTERYWFVLGSLFFPIPLIVLALLPAHRAENVA